MSAARLADYKPLENMPAAEIITMLAGGDFHAALQHRVVFYGRSPPKGPR